MTPPTKSPSIEARLRALHDELPECDGYRNIKHPGLDCDTLRIIRTAAALGDAAGYARGLEDAAVICDGLAADPMENAASEVACGWCAARIRARAAEVGR